MVPSLSKHHPHFSSEKTAEPLNSQRKCCQASKSTKSTCVVFKDVPAGTLRHLKKEKGGGIEDDIQLLESDLTLLCKIFH